MTTDQIIILSTLAVYFLAMIIMGVVGGIRESQDDFIIASRNVGIIPTAATMAASFRDGMGIVFWFGIAATLGYGGVWLFAGVLAGMMLYATLGPAMRRMALENNFITIGEVIRNRIGPLSERLTGAIIIITALVLIAAQLYVAGHVFAKALQAPAMVGIWIVAGVAALYLCLGGYSNVIKTDVLQFVIMFSLFATVFFLPPPMEKVLAFETITSMGLKNSAALGIIGFFYVWCSADSWQRIFSARNDRVIRAAYPLAAIFLIALTASLLFLGMAAAPRVAPGVSADMAFYELFNPGFIAPGLQAFIAVVAMAVCMSTLSPACYVSASTLARNFLPKTVSADKKSYIRFSRFVMLTVMVVTACAAMMIGNLIEFLFGALSILYVLFPVILLAVLGRQGSPRRDRLIVAATAVSVLVYIYMFAGGYLGDLLLTLVPVGCNILLCGLAVLLTRGRHA